MEFNENVAFIGFLSYNDWVADFRRKDATGLRPKKRTDR